MRTPPDKTFIGRVTRGFDFLGYRCHPTGLHLALMTLLAFLATWHRLYEQGAPRERRVHYVRCWLRWARAGEGQV